VNVKLERRRVPEVNLLDRNRHAGGEPSRLSRRKVEIALILLVALVWSSVALAIALLLGVHLDPRLLGR
jgi:hypothetical protein